MRIALSSRLVAIAGLLVVMATLATACGGAKAGTVQVTNDTGTTVTVAECPPSTPAGCAAPIGRKVLGSGASATYAPVKCATTDCQATEIVVTGSAGAVQCSPAPPLDGKHSFLFLVSTLPTTGCDQYQS